MKGERKRLNTGDQMEVKDGVDDKEEAELLRGVTDFRLSFVTCKIVAPIQLFVITFALWTEFNKKKYYFTHYYNNR